jgi:hypothetical protein
LYRFTGSAWLTDILLIIHEECLLPGFLQSKEQDVNSAVDISLEPDSLLRIVSIHWVGND